MLENGNTVGQQTHSGCHLWDGKFGFCYKIDYYLLNSTAELLFIQ